MEQSIGVFGQEILLWACLLRQTPQRPPPQVVYQQATGLLDELQREEATRTMPVQAVEDGTFAIAAFIDEVAMTLPDLRPMWSQYTLQATRFGVNDAGVQVFQRIDRVRQGPRHVLATYAVILGLGFQGSFALPGADKYQLAQLRRDLAVELGVDPDRDWEAGTVKQVHRVQVESLGLFKPPWYRSLWLGRALAILALLSASISFALLLT